MELSTQEQALADLVRQARSSKTLIEGKQENRGVDLAGAYRVQAASRSSVLKGYKLGLISPAKQQQMGIDMPIYGRIYADMLPQSPVSLSNFIQPRVEPEIALVLRDSVAPDVNVGVVAQAIGGYFLGVDLLDSVWNGFKFNAAEVVADNASGGAFLLAGCMTAALESGTLRLYVNGELQTEGHTDALGNPIQRVQWLAQQVGTLNAGTIIFLGSPAAAVAAKPSTLEVLGAGGQRLLAKLTD